jgi:large subunit ribosomal protein L22
MLVRAFVKQIRISPRKVRLVAGLIRGQDAQAAEQQLRFSTKAAARPVRALLRSAIANAENNFELAVDNLFVKAVEVNAGPTYKRWHAEAKGVAAEILKRTSQITIVLDERVKGKKPVRAKKAKARPSVTRLQTKKEIAKLAGKQEGKTPAAGRQPRAKGGQLEKHGGPGVRGFMNKIFRRKSEG